jgi:Tfp pilus assembly ATPase PilU
MKKLVSALVVLGLAMPLAAMAETWENVSLADKACAEKFKGHMDDHPKACAEKCSKNGLGIVTQDGTFLKLDKAGNKQAQAALKESDQKDHVRVNVTGDKKGDTVHVTSLKLAKS